ncbi:trypsin-like serine peptidase [Nonomuraea sp. NPDC050451]|uniref:trypsin-like serine peptidase n=1 Tax=Nonomuraea sp. NPDC050451 TaxID=3364364 RepID=UPI0037BD0719
MKRILLPAGGAILATGLLAAGLATTAQADDTVSADVLASQQKAAETLDFWTKSNYAALKQAVAFNPDALEVTKISSGGGYTSDTKPGSTAPIGEEKKATVKVQNVNLPKTIGKVFFEGRDGKLYWCSGTSIQSQYRNLVATAGHCVYDIAGNDEVVSRWVFVPGYYQGKAPWGVYVGKQAFTHYDFDVYEDFDRDYAFVTVYDGIGGVLNKETKVSPSEYKAHIAKGGKGYVKETPITKEEFAAGFDKYGEAGPFKSKLADPSVETVAMPKDAAAKIEDYISKGVDGVQLTGVEVTEATYKAAKSGYDNGDKFERLSTEVPISKEAYDALVAAKGDGKFLGTVRTNDAKTAWFKTQYYVKKWVKTTAVMKYWVEDYYVVENVVKSVGRLGDNVGGQGFAWNQPAGKYVRTFGYPYGPHLDGNKPFTGVTPKWCYGKTASKALLIPSKKVEEQVSLKCTVTAGYDGGPWLYKYSNAKRLGYVNGVTSLIADTDGNKRYDTITSAYFDGETNVVYKAAAAAWSGKLIP